MDREDELVGTTGTLSTFLLDSVEKTVDVMVG
jgi:hypothetical protein